MNEKKREELSSKEEMRRLDEKVTALSFLLKEKSDKMQELEEEIVRVKGGLEQRIGEFEKEVPGSADKMESVDEKVTALSFLLKEKSDKMQELEEEIVRVKGGLEQRIGEFEKEVPGIADKIESVDEKVTALSVSLQKNSSESKQLNEKISCRLKDVEEKVGGRLEKVENRAPEVSKEDMGNAEEKISELYNNLDRLSRDIRRYLGIADIKDTIGQIVKKK